MFQSTSLLLSPSIFIFTFAVYLSLLLLASSALSFSLSTPHTLPPCIPFIDFDFLSISHLLILILFLFSHSLSLILSSSFSFYSLFLIVSISFSHSQVSSLVGDVDSALKKARVSVKDTSETANVILQKVVTATEVFVSFKKCYLLQINSFLNFVYILFIVICRTCILFFCHTLLFNFFLLN